MFRKFKTEILIRDGRLKPMIDDGVKVNYETLSQDAILKHLRDKVLEEAGELVRETEKDAIVEEMADLYEVLDAIKSRLDISEAEVRAYQEKKRKRLGGFDMGYYTHHVEVDENNKEQIGYYLANLHKYPEIK